VVYYSYMALPIASGFQIGVDNALIQVPQNYTVPANPPTPHNPPNLGDTPNPNGTTKDSVTLYVSAIKGFNHALTISYFIRKIDFRVNSDTTTLPVDDYTLVPADGDALPLRIGTDVTNLTTVSAPVWDGINFGWHGPITASDDITLLTLYPNASNSLNTYVAQNYVTLWINPNTTGGGINPAHPPAYQVNLYAADITDPHATNTCASCSFTLVVLPSINTYGLGVYETSYINSVSLKPSGANSYDLYYAWYPLEPKVSAPADFTVTYDTFHSPIFNDDSGGGGSLFGLVGS